MATPTAFRRVVSMLTLLLVALWAGLGAAVVTATPASAQATETIDIIEDVATIIDFDGYYDSEGADIDRFEALIDRANATGDNWYFVSLSGEPAGGPSVYAGQLADLIPDSGTIIVVNPYNADGETRFEAGTWSADYSDAQLNAGEDLAAATLSGRSGSAIDVAEAMFDGVSAQPKAAVSDSGSGSSGPSAAWLLVPLGAGAVGLVGYGWWNRRKSNRRDELDEGIARREIRHQLDAVANQVIGQAEYVELSDNAQAQQYYAEATATYTAVDDKLKRAETLLELAQLNDQIDLARWQMEAAEALIEGRDLPPKPTPDNPLACFFDPTHRPGMKVVTIKTAAGNKDVRVCADDAARLARGEKPEPRMIDVHGRRIPAAKAPRSHGGLGMGGIDFFDILVGGMGRAGRPMGRRTRRQRTPTSSFPWDWNNGRATQPRPRNSGGVFGPDRLPRSRQSSGRPGRPRNSTRPRRRTTGKRSSTGRSRRRF